jgi:hypothetical protein
MMSAPASTASCACPQALHLADQKRARFLDRRRERRRRSERQHQRRGRMREHEVQQFRPALQRPGDEAAADPRIAGGGKFPLQPLAVAIAAADQPEPTRGGDGGRQPPARGKAHRRG